MEEAMSLGSKKRKFDEMSKEEEEGDQIGE